jgi:hypothetical protein
MPFFCLPTLPPSSSRLRAATLGSPGEAEPANERPGSVRSPSLAARDPRHPVAAPSGRSRHVRRAARRHRRRPRRARVQSRAARTSSRGVEAADAEARVFGATAGVTRRADDLRRARGERRAHAARFAVRERVWDDATIDVVCLAEASAGAGPPLVSAAGRPLERCRTAGGERRSARIHDGRGLGRARAAVHVGAADVATPSALPNRSREGARGQ